jgi:hypothetical protein
MPFVQVSEGPSGAILEGFEAQTIFHFFQARRLIFKAL